MTSLPSLQWANDVFLHILFYRFFKESSDEEREHAEKFMEYQVSITLLAT